MKIVLIIVFAVVAIIFVFKLIRMHLDKKFLLKCFDDGNVLVYGLRGRGKDMLFEFVTSKRNSPYVSNVNYTNDSNYTPLDFTKLDIQNERSNFVSGDIKKYIYPYADNTDVFISDCGVYFPSYDNNKLNKEYPRVPLFNALSRHLGNCNVHCNIQNLNRLWLTFREQSDIYIKACGCKVFFHRFVFMRYRMYDRYSSALDGVRPFAYSSGFGKEKRMRIAEFQAKFGDIREGSFFFILKHKYNDRYFKYLLENGN